MSFITYVVECPKCKERFNTAFGIQGTTLIADPLRECPDCKIKVVKVHDGWDTGIK